MQNAIDLAHVLLIEQPKVAILSAVETVNPRIPSTIDAAALCKMADRGQITGGLLDGPLAFDNAISLEAAAEKGIVSPVAGRADILVAPDLVAGNILAKQLTFLAGAVGRGRGAGGPHPDHPDQPSRQRTHPHRLVRHGRAGGGGPDGQAAGHTDEGLSVADAVLTLNAGSSSIKFALFEIDAPEPTLVFRGEAEGLGGASPRLRAADAAGAAILDRSWPNGADLTHEDVLGAVLDCAEGHLGGDRIVAFAHRVTHGGPNFADPVEITPTSWRPWTPSRPWRPCINRTI